MTRAERPAEFRRKWLSEKQAQKILDRLGMSPAFEIVPHYVGQAKDAEGRFYDTWKTGILDRFELRMTYDKGAGRGSAVIASIGNPAHCYDAGHIPADLERQREEAVALVAYFLKRQGGGNVERARLAGESHAVATIKGGGNGVMRQPCPSCPWKRASVGEFPPEAFVISAHTAYDMATETFGCHTAGQENPKTCAGYVLRGSAHSLSGRLATMRGDYDGVTDGGEELFANYREMAEANGVSPDHPALLPIRTDF